MLTYDYFTPPSLLSPQEFAKVLNLNVGFKTNFEPLNHTKYMGSHYFEGFDSIYLDHSELKVIGQSFKRLSASEPKIMPKLLALNPSKETILHAQEVIEELGENDKLYNSIEQILLTQNIFLYSSENPGQGMYQQIKISPEKTKKFLENISGLEKFNPKSKGLIELLSWSERINKDKLYKEISQEKELAKKSRIISIAEPEFGESLLFGKLKEGVNIEDVVDFYNPNIAYFVNYDVPRGSPDHEKQEFMEIKGGVLNKKNELVSAKEINEKIVLSSRQRLDFVNKKTAELLTTSLFAVVTQLYHAHAGANFYRYLKKNNYPLSFPEISDERAFSMEKMYPIRLLLERMNVSDEDRKMYNEIRNVEDEIIYPVNYSLDSQIVQIEGPNKNGKTELLRTMYLGVHMANSGWPWPCEKGTISVFPGTHFFKFKKTPGTGGSELEKDIHLLQTELKHTFKDDLIVIDEFGDATNSETACELGRRYFPVLLERNNVLLLSSHQSELRHVIQELRGLTYRPACVDPNPYQPVIAEGPTDFMAKSVLDKLKITSENLRDSLPKNKIYDSKKTYELPLEDDSPF